jgi:indole-3-glycerol phosphate synthase
VDRFLDRVVREKEAEIAVKRAARSAADLARRAAGVPVRDFRTALSGDGRVIAEIKRRSPSVPAFRHGGDVAGLARIYRDNGAAAISIVTDEANFGTCLADVARVRGAVELPVLVKDFVIGAYQVIEARAAGADALLLIARILAADSLARLLGHVHDLGMQALVECHDEADVDLAVQAGARIVGVNNRDLATLATSLGACERLLPRIPAGVLRVAESGIGRRGDVVELARQGAHAFLVGGALLNSPDPGRKLRELLGAESEPAGDGQG